MAINHKRLKIACYSTSVSTSVVCNLSPLFFLIFRTTYGISYTLLGLLVLVNFLTQLLVDLVFSLFSHKFNISLTVKITPMLTAIGLILYAILPVVMPEFAYLGLIIGTLFFSAAGGLAEVLLSPVIAAIPSKDPDREMSKLHSVYAWGVFGVVIFATLFLFVFGNEYWYILVLVFALIPIFAVLAYQGVTIPSIGTPEKASGALRLLKNKGVWLFFIAIFLGGASELIMAQWCSGYIEQALGIPKVLGDIFGVALFSVALGLGRTLYAKFGKNTVRVLLLGSIGATVCYFVAAVINVPVIGLVACVLTGFCVSLLWPGSLIVASDRYPKGGVFIYALIAAGGDLGASVGPQLVGVITDISMASPVVVDLALKLGFTAEQMGLKIGMLFGTIFPLLGILFFAIIYRLAKKNTKIKLLNENDS